MQASLRNNPANYQYHHNQHHEYVSGSVSFAGQPPEQTSSSLGNSEQQQYDGIACSTILAHQCAALEAQDAAAATIVHHQHHSEHDELLVESSMLNATHATVCDDENSHQFFTHQIHHYEYQQQHHHHQHNHSHNHHHHGSILQPSEQQHYVDQQPVIYGCYAAAAAAVSTAGPHGPGQHESGSAAQVLVLDNEKVDGVVTAQMNIHYGDLYAPPDQVAICAQSSQIGAAGATEPAGHTSSSNVFYELPQTTYNSCQRMQIQTASYSAECHEQQAPATYHTLDVVDQTQTSLPDQQHQSASRQSDHNRTSGHDEPPPFEADNNQGDRDQIFVRSEGYHILEQRDMNHLESHQQAGATTTTTAIVTHQDNQHQQLAAHLQYYQDESSGRCNPGSDFDNNEHALHYQSDTDKLMYNSSSSSFNNNNKNSNNNNDSTPSNASSSCSNFSSSSDLAESLDSTLTRDEKKAREANIPLSYFEIVNLSIDQFNEHVSKFSFTEAQLTLMKDIRRRGKNKVAAQTCRKRKMEQISELQHEVNQLIERKMALNLERSNLENEHQHLLKSYEKLCATIRQHLDNRGEQLATDQTIFRQLHHDRHQSSALLGTDEKTCNQQQRNAETRLIAM